MVNFRRNGISTYGCAFHIRIDGKDVRSDGSEVWRPSGEFDFISDQLILDRAAQYLEALLAEKNPCALVATVHITTLPTLARRRAYIRRLASSSKKGL